MEDACKRNGGLLEERDGLPRNLERFAIAKSCKVKFEVAPAKQPPLIGEPAQELDNRMIFVASICARNGGLLEERAVFLIAPNNLLNGPGPPKRLLNDPGPISPDNNVLQVPR